MKMLKDCDVEVGDVIFTILNGVYEFVKYDSNDDSFPYRVINLERGHYDGLSNDDSFPYRVINLERGHYDGLSKDCVVSNIIKKDPKKKILEKIEEHKAEIKNLENQLKELNSLKVGEVYRVKTDFIHSGIRFACGEIIFIKTIFKNSLIFVYKNGIMSIDNELDSSKFELVNDPEMKNGLTKFFKGTSE